MLDNLAAKLLVTAGVIAAASLCTTVTAEASASTTPHRSCDGTDPAGRGDARTVKRASGQVTMELRYSPSYQCGWARLTGGHPGSQLWVDRSQGDTNVWEPWLGLTQVDFGTSNYTSMWDDSGMLERACGNWVNGGPTVCTDWY
uniref:DUF2690 domain-containing protein n=1 Tax=Amycolatopsis sp. CA-096443 TaxID=3239919 RepID=UPI003F49A77F